MASRIESDGRTVTVTTDEGHRIGFVMAEMNAPSTSGEITTDWAGNATPRNTEATVQAAKAEAEAYTARHHAAAPDEARATQNPDETVAGSLKAIFALGL